MNARSLWERRRAAYLRETMPYWRYVLGSGGLAMGFAFILLVQGYASLLNRARADGALEPWFAAFAAAAVAAALAWNPARTYVTRADLVLLLPMEARLAEYFRAARTLGAAWSGAALAAALALYAPFYAAAGFGGAAAYAGAAAAVLALKALLAYGAWKERQFRYAGARFAFAAAKAAAAFATAYTLLRGPLDIAAAGLLALWAAYAAALRAPQAYRYHWERLVETERRTVALHEAWFGLFVDLPHRAETYRARPYWNALLRLLPHKRPNAFLYLYWRTFLRSTMSVLALRIVAVEALLVWAFPHPGAAAAVFAASCWIMGLQLRGIRTPPEEPLLAAMSPLPDELRERSQRSVQRAAQLVLTALLAVPLAAVAPPGLAAACAAGGAAAAFLFARKRHLRL